MKKKNERNLWISVSMMIAFVIWTIAVSAVDVRPIGPRGSLVGFASINALIHELTGVHMTLYHLTDWLGLVPVLVALGFAVLGFVQWISKKQLRKVDHSLLVLGGFYIVVIAIYVLFEMISINYRPVLIDGVLETSYPSSTTLLVMCVMPTTVMQCNSRIRNQKVRKWAAIFIVMFTIFMVVGRLISGVHWFTDIVGGALLSAGLVTTYRYIINLNMESERENSKIS